MDEQRAEDSGSGESETDSSSDPDSEDSGSAAFAQRVHPAEQFRAERGEAEDVDSFVDTIRSRQCTPRAATWLKKTETPLNPPPEINVEEFNIFFSSFSTFQQHPSARAHMVGYFYPP